MTNENPVPYPAHGLTWQDPTDWSSETIDGVWYAEQETKARWKGLWTLSRRAGKELVRYGLHATKDKAQYAASKHAAKLKPPVPSRITASAPRPEDVTDEMAARVKALVLEYEGSVRLAVIIGVLQIVAYELLRDED